MERASELVMAVQVTMYVNEADEWHKRPLHLEILNYLRAENVAGATVFHAVAGFTGRGRVKTTSLVDAGEIHFASGGKLVIKARVVAPEGAYAYHGNTDFFISRQSARLGRQERRL